MGLLKAVFLAICTSQWVLYGAMPPSSQGLQEEHVGRRSPYTNALTDPTVEVRLKPVSGPGLEMAGCLDAG